MVSVLYIVQLSWGHYKLLMFYNLKNDIVVWIIYCQINLETRII